MRLLILLQIVVLAIGNDKVDLPGHMKPIGSHRPPEESISILSYVPDPVEFYVDYVIMQTPVLFKKAIAGTPALTKWNDDRYLRYELLVLIDVVCTSINPMPAWGSVCFSV